MKNKFCELQPFLDYLFEQLSNNSIYVWGGQGQILGKTTLDDLISMETSVTQVKTILNHIADIITNKTFNADLAKLFDCSGLGSYWFYNTTHIIDRDYNANSFMEACVEIPTKLRQPGDFVFSSITDKGVAQHIGYVVADKSVTEARGRAYGVVNRPYTEGKWKKVGRAPFFSYHMTRVLSKGCKGQDVGQLQARLTSYGYPLGVIDDDFGNKTSASVKAFQKANKLSADGVVGKDTAEKLGFKFDN